MNVDQVDRLGGTQRGQVVEVQLDPNFDAGERRFGQVRRYNIKWHPVIDMKCDTLGRLGSVEIIPAGETTGIFDLSTSRYLGIDEINDIATSLTDYCRIVSEVKNRYARVELLRAALDMPRGAYNEMHRAQKLGKRASELLESSLQLEIGLFPSWTYWRHTKKTTIVKAMKNLRFTALLVKNELNRHDPLGTGGEVDNSDGESGMDEDSQAGGESGMDEDSQADGDQNQGVNAPAEHDVNHPRDPATIDLYTPKIEPTAEELVDYAIDQSVERVESDSPWKAAWKKEIAVSIAYFRAFEEAFERGWFV